MASYGARGPSPYRWHTSAPRHLVPRDKLLEHAQATAAGEESTLLILGTRGMGKSVFLGDLKEKLKGTARLEVLFFSKAPAARGDKRTVPELVEVLLDELLKSARRRIEGDRTAALEGELQRHASKLRLREILETYCDHFSADTDRLVLLYDELDSYAEEGSVAGQHYFDALEDARKNMGGALSIVAAGGLGMLSLRVLAQGSSMFSRASRQILVPFRDEDIAFLAEDLRASVGALPDETLPTLRVLSGGNPLLVTYGLDRLWKAEQPSAAVLTKAFDDFRDHGDPGFVRSVLEPVFDAKYGRLPAAAWRALNRATGRLSQAELRELRREAGPESALDGRDFFDMLRASGLVTMASSASKEDPIVVELVPSILRSEVDDILSEVDVAVTAGQQTSFQGQLREDLIVAMTELHRMTPAFYHQLRMANEGPNPTPEGVPSAGGIAPSARAKGGRSARGRPQLLPEAAFSAGLVLALTGRRWRAELEAMSGAGYTDIKARHKRFNDQEAIVEVKIWGRNDYQKIHEQVTSYFARGVTALATIMVTDRKNVKWPQTYQSECLGSLKASWHPLPPPLEGYFEAHAGGHVVEHFLLRLPSRS